MELIVHEESSVRIADYQCAGRCRGRGSEEESDSYEIVLPRAGMFVRHVNGQSIVGDSNHALFFNRGECYRVSHPVEGGDRCTVLAFPIARIQDCLSHLDPRSLDEDAPLFTRTHTPTSPATDLLHRQLLRVAQLAPEPFTIEEVATGLLGQLLSNAISNNVPRETPARRAVTLRRYDELVMAVREQLAERLGKRLKLEEIATAVHTSHFHLSRIFKLRTGISISRYHRRLRLRTALERILDGEKSLTRLALDLGFSSHSHFTDAFHKEFGLAPTASRDGIHMAALKSAPVKYE